MHMGTPHHLSPLVLGWQSWAVLVAVLTLVLLLGVLVR
jgi:hypothetical protein